MWGKKKPEVAEQHVETDAEYWARMGAARDAAQVQPDDDHDWDGYGPPPALSDEAEAHLFDYELSAYTPGHTSADGFERVSFVQYGGRQ